jgi:2-oxoglutarate dehydrogenase E1 component
VRISGEDVGRGTFFHRHAALHDQNRDSWNEGTLWPLQRIGDQQGSFYCYDSVLSEEAVLAFEYGYATATPDELVVWEAQFGDFANGAQVVIDQFLSSGEAKWGRGCGLVLLLPHGYEGQGPEHSSARLERYMQLSADFNWEVCMPSTAGQIFHLLRRQMLRKQRKPLIVMTPKSLLRLKDATSPLEELARGPFHTVIGEIDEVDAKKVTRVIACAGKVYFDLLAERRKLALDNVAIIRIEQLYPMDDRRFAEELQKYPNAKHIVWCQEEPLNQGAWYAKHHTLTKVLKKGQTLDVAARSASASPAVGYAAKHVIQQQEVVNAALGVK